MDAEDELAVKAINNDSVMQPESLSQQDAHEVHDSAELSLTTSPESTTDEISLPPLIQEEPPESERRIFPSEIPDSEAVFDFTSPVKPRQELRVEAPTPDAGNSSLAVPDDSVVQQDALPTEDAGIEDGTTKEDETQEIERSLGITSNADTLDPPGDLDKGEIAVPTLNSGTTGGLTATNYTTSEVKVSAEDESFGTPEVSTAEKHSLGEVEEVGNVTAEENGRNTVESSGSHNNSEAATLPEPVEVETAASVGQDEEPVVEPKVSILENVSVMGSLSTAPEETDDAEIKPSIMASEDRSEEPQAKTALPTTLPEEVKADDEALQTQEPAYSQNLVENPLLDTDGGLQEPGISILAMDGEDSVMVEDENPKANELLVNSETTETHEIPEQKTEKEASESRPAQQRSIADSDDEEMSDAAMIEELPEPEPKVSKRGRKKSKTTGKPAEKVAKKRGGPKKAVAPEVQQPEPMEEVNDELETANAPPESMDLDEQTSLPRKDIADTPPEPTKITPDTIEPTHDHGSTQGSSSIDTPKEIKTPICSSPQRSTVPTPIKVRLSPNPSFRMPSPVKKNQSRSSSMILSSPSRQSSSSAISTSQEGDDATESQNQTRDAVLTELKVIKMASIQGRISALQAEIAAKQARRDELQKDLKQPAAETVKRHIKLLHDYNDIKDIGQGLVGMIADQRGLRIAELYEEFGVDVKD